MATVKAARGERERETGAPRRASALARSAEYPRSGSGRHGTARHGSFEKEARRRPAPQPQPQPHSQLSPDETRRDYKRAHKTNASHPVGSSTGCGWRTAHEATRGAALRGSARLGSQTPTRTIEEKRGAKRREHNDEDEDEGTERNGTERKGTEGNRMERM